MTEYSLSKVIQAVTEASRRNRRSSQAIFAMVDLEAFQLMEESDGICEWWRSRTAINMNCVPPHWHQFVEIASSLVVKLISSGVKKIDSNGISSRDRKCQS